MPVSITELLTPERIRTGLEVQSKKKLLEEISALLAPDESGESGRATVCKEMFQREQLGSTGIGNGVALPHCRLQGLAAPRGAIVVLSRPLSYEAADGLPVSLAFGLAVPAEASDEHLQILAQLARLFSDTGLCERLINSNDAHALRRVLVAHEGTAGDGNEHRDSNSASRTPAA